MLLTNDDGLRARLGERVKYVIVDEYQDVNPIQEAIVWSLHDLGARICVVGDDDQTIYQWRGSDVENILTFEHRYPEVEQIPLEENFRSSDGVVETARAFIEQNGTRLAKAMKPTGAQPSENGDIVALSFVDPEAEAQHIAETIQSLRGVAFQEDGVERGLSWSDMAVLLRSVKANAEPITQALQAAGIPFVVTGMTNLFGTRRGGGRAAALLLHRRPTGSRCGRAWSSTWKAARPRLRLVSSSIGRSRVLPQPRRRSPTRSRSGGGSTRSSACSSRSSRRQASARSESRRSGRGRLLQPRQVQPGHLRLRDDPLPLEAGREVRLVRRLPAVPRRGRLPRRLAGQPIRQPRRRADHDRPPGQGDAVAGGVRAGAASRTASRPRGSGAATSGTCCPRAGVQRTARVSRARSRTSGGSSTSR